MGNTHTWRGRPRESTLDSVPQCHTSLDDLPDELLVHIARRLDCMAIYSTMPRVSRRWRTIVSDRSLLGPPSCRAACLVKDRDGNAKVKAWRLYDHALACPRRRLACADAIKAGAGPKALRHLKKSGHAYNRDTVMAAIIANDIPCLAFTHASKTLLKTEHAETAARLGRADVLTWIIDHEGLYSWNADIAAMAARFGHLDCLRLAHQSGVKWDRKVAVAAARGGHVDCLDYAYYYGCPWPASELYSEAKAHGHKACCDYISRHTNERLPSEPSDTALVVLAVSLIMTLIIALFVLAILGIVHLVNKNAA